MKYVSHQLSFKLQCLLIWDMEDGTCVLFDLYEIVRECM